MSKLIAITITDPDERLVVVVSTCRSLTPHYRWMITQMVKAARERIAAEEDEGTGSGTP